MDRQSIPAFAKLFFTVQFLSIAALAQMPALSPLPETAALSQPANPAQFTFVLAGDNRPAHPAILNPPFLETSSALYRE